MEPRTRSLWSIGRRVERLLLGGAGLVALALLAFYLASAAQHYAEDRMSQGLESLALLIEGDDKVLQRFYELESQRQKLAAKKKEPVSENFYVKALEDKVARAAALSGADAPFLRGLVSETQPPADLVKTLRERKKELDERPATVAGVVVPSSSLGTRLPAAFVANVLIITLAPLIILWLGALRTTRSREMQAIETTGIAYPHALNAYDLPLESLVLRHAHGRWTALGSPGVKAALLAFVRMAMLALLVVPMIGAYIGTVTTLGMGSQGGWLRALYAFVVFVIMLVQAAGLLLAEAPAPVDEPCEGPDEDDYVEREEPRMSSEDVTREFRDR